MVLFLYLQGAFAAETTTIITARRILSAELLASDSNRSLYRYMKVDNRALLIPALYGLFKSIDRLTGRLIFMSDHCL